MTLCSFFPSPLISSHCIHKILKEQQKSEQPKPTCNNNSTILLFPLPFCPCPWPCSDHAMHHHYHHQLGNHSIIIFLSIPHWFIIIVGTIFHSSPFPTLPYSLRPPDTHGHMDMDTHKLYSVSCAICACFHVQYFFKVFTLKSSRNPTPLCNFCS